MCLYPKTGILTADVDFYTFKLLKSHGSDRGIYSPFFPFLWEMGKRYSLGKELSVQEDGFLCEDVIEEGFHSFYIIGDKSDLINNDRGNLMMGHLIALSKIPKGSKYVIGSCDEIVSDTIIIERILITTNFNLLNNETETKFLHPDRVKAHEIIRWGFDMVKDKYNLIPPYFKTINHD